MDGYNLKKVEIFVNIDYEFCLVDMDINQLEWGWGGWNDVLR